MLIDIVFIDYRFLQNIHVYLSVFAKNIATEFDMSLTILYYSILELALNFH